MNKILIVSATKGENYILAKKIHDLCEPNISKKYISLEDYDLPLFKASNYNDLKDKHSEVIKLITDELVNANGLIICAPEYNGNIPPILANTISWISVSTDYWRDAFINKFALIATNSGGPAVKYSISLKNQLEHLGMIVMPQYISVSSNNPLNDQNVQKKIKQFLKHV
tara:strand:- start:1185 stop:1691 length:507 start_codon:yes stop_codon:yes gene_type:complete